MNTTEINIVNQRSNKAFVKINNQKIAFEGLETKLLTIPSKKIQMECFQYGFWLLKSRSYKVDAQDNLEVDILKYSFSAYTLLQFFFLFIMTSFGIAKFYTSAWPLWILAILVFYSVVQIVFFNDILDIKQSET
jgi:hypothetical protein